MGAGCHQDPRKRWDRGLSSPCCSHLEPFSLCGRGVREAGTLRCRSLSLWLAVSRRDHRRESQADQSDVPSRCPKRVGRRRQAYPGHDPVTTNGRKRRLGMSPEGRRILQMRNEEIFRLWDQAGESFGTIALKFSLARSTIQKIIEQQRKGREQ